MNIKGFFKKSSIPLATFLLLLLSFYLVIKLLGYTFIPLNGLVSNIFTTVTIVLLTIIGVKTRSNKTKATIVFSALLPLISLIYIFFKAVSSDISGESHGLYFVLLTGKSTIIYVIHAYITLLCSMVIFFACGRGKTVRIVLGILYSLLLLYVSFLMFLLLMFSDFGENTVVKAGISPNNTYLAEIINADQGAMGGSTIVNVTRQNRDINILIGKLKKDPKRIYTGRWGEFYDMTLRWETDETLYINAQRYSVE